jgi:hypothetical protein
MFSRAGVFLLTSIVLLSACSTAKKAAVTSFRVLDAPARFVRERIDEEEGGTTTTTTTTQVTDVANPGYPVPQAPPPSAPTRRTTAGPTQPRSSVTETPRQTTRSETGASGRTAPAATPRPQVAQFPTARPVAGRPGYVYSIDPNGGIVDVTGYKPGDKAKDPYTQKVFIVP